MKKLESVLTRDEADFVRRVFAFPGCKLNDGPCGVWQKPERLGLIECVGSYKWKPTEKLEVGIKSAAK